ncbi:MAG: metallophosphoesterase [Ginsengibacter sp.]
MPLSRRKFLKLSLNGAVIINANNVLQPFTKGVFNFAPANRIVTRFAIASDGHYGQPATEYEFLHDQMIEWLNAEKKNRGIDFTIINGDLFHNDVTFLPNVKSKWDQLKMPYYVSHGNHDETPEDNWKKIWNTPWHYSFEQKDAAFIVINSADDKGTYICPDVEWTKNELQRFKSKKQLFVFMHITPFKWTGAGLPCPEIVELFDKQKNLKAVFHGHDHDQDDVKVNNGKYYFFDSHVAGNWGTDYNGYRIVEILKSGEIITYQMNPSSRQKVNNKDIS